MASEPTKEEIEAKLHELKKINEDRFINNVIADSIFSVILENYAAFWRKLDLKEKIALQSRLNNAEKTYNVGDFNREIIQMPSNVKEFYQNLIQDLKSVCTVQSEKVVKAIEEIDEDLNTINKSKTELNDITVKLKKEMAGEIGEQEGLDSIIYLATLVSLNVRANQLNKKLNENENSLKDIKEKLTVSNGEMHKLGEILKELESNLQDPKKNATAAEEIVKTKEAVRSLSAEQEKLFIEKSKVETDNEAIAKEIHDIQAKMSNAYKTYTASKANTKEQDPPSFDPKYYYQKSQQGFHTQYDTSQKNTDKKGLGNQALDPEQNPREVLIAELGPYLKDVNPASATDEQLDKARKNFLLENHPDKLSHISDPAEIQSRTDKATRVSTAWGVLQEEKNKGKARPGQH